jgi:hypothetical protein
MSGFSGSSKSGGVHALLPKAAGGYHANWLNAVTMTTTTGGADALQFFPFYPANSFTADQVAITIATGVASSTVRIGIYSDSNGAPGTLLADSGDISTATTGDKTATISQAFSAGRVYWICVHRSAGSIVVRAIAKDSTFPTQWFTNGIGTEKTGTQTYGPLPASPPVLTDDSNLIPLIRFRVA